MKNMRLRTYKILFSLIFSLIFHHSYAQNKSSSDVHVRGYYRRNGTYVAPHYRSVPNNTRTDNFSTFGNVNPYTGKEGTLHIENSNNLNSNSIKEKIGDVKTYSTTNNNKDSDLSKLLFYLKVFEDSGIDIKAAIKFNNKYSLDDRVIIKHLVYKIIRNEDIYDGNIDLFTVTAIMEFQMDNNLKIDGKAGKETYNRLLDAYPK
jgi:peptidoglycan hydrolase-like protein with peptidoglycan-binding domain